MNNVSTLNEHLLFIICPDKYDKYVKNGKST